MFHMKLRTLNFSTKTCCALGQDEAHCQTGLELAAVMQSKLQMESEKD